MKNSLLRRGRNVSEAVAIQKKLVFLWIAARYALAMTKKTALTMKNNPSWRGRNVSEAVAIQKKLSFSMDCRALRARNDEKNGAHNEK
jgi:hypothetical protein